MSTASLGSMMMPLPSQDLLQLAASGARPAVPGSAPASPDGGANGLLDLDTFCRCMEEAVKARRCVATCAACAAPWHAESVAPHGCSSALWPSSSAPCVMP